MQAWAAVVQGTDSICPAFKICPSITNEVSIHVYEAAIMSVILDFSICINWCAQELDLVGCVFATCFLINYDQPFSSTDL